VLSWDQLELERGKKEITIAPSARENVFTVKTGIKNTPLKFAEIIFHLDIPGQAIPGPFCH